MRCGYLPCAGGRRVAAGGRASAADAAVDPANVRALRVCERAGFVLVETDDAVRGTSLIMVLEL